MSGGLTEQGNSCRDDKGKYKRITREANTDELHGGGSHRSTYEASVMELEGRVRTGSVLIYTTTVKRDD